MNSGKLRKYESVRLQTVLLELGGDNEGKRKAVQYPEKKLPKETISTTDKSFYVSSIQHGNIRHAPRVKLNMMLMAH